MKRLNSSLKLGIVYFLFGIVWVFASDYLALLFAGDDLAAYTRFQNYKGVLFFLISGLLVYIVSTRLNNDLVKATKEQAKALARYNSLFRATKDAIWDLNLETNSCYTNKVLQEKFGFTEEELSVGHDWWVNGIHEQDREGVLSRMEKKINEGEDIWEDEYRFLCKDGTVKMILDRGIILRDEAGIPYRMIGSMQDVTNQRSFQKAFTEEKVQYRNDLAKRVINAQEQERRKIGLELHDNFSQLLGVVKLYIENAIAFPADREESLQKSALYISEVIGELRKLSKSLSPSALIDIGLVDSIYDLADSLRESGNLQVFVNFADFDEKRLPEEKKLMIFRIIEEQVQNVTEHSAADTLYIELSNRKDLIRLVVQDNGQGFDGANIAVGRGLANIRNRLELFNGNMEIISSPGDGCRLEVAIEGAY